jgi:hypothetical protein
MARASDRKSLHPGHVKSHLGKFKKAAKKAQALSVLMSRQMTTEDLATSHHKKVMDKEYLWRSAILEKISGLGKSM